VALEEAQARAASLAEQTRQAEADANDAKQQLGEAANRAAAAAERAGELGEEVKRQRMRAEEAETQVLAVSVERDRALSKAKQLEAEVQAKGVALMMREGASSAKVAELSEREVRLSGALEEERARAGALARQLASSKEREENARIEGARLGARMAEVEARGKAVEVELEETKAAVVRAELALHGAGGAGQGDVVDKITAMQTQLMDALAALRAERDKGAALEMARVQAVKDRNESGDELILCRDQCERLEGDVALQAAALASERAAAQRARAQAESELLKERQMVAQLERQCSDIKVWAEQAEDKVLALTGKLEHAQQQARVLGAEVEALRGRGELLRRTLDSVRVEKTKALGEQRGIVAAFRHEVRSLERQLAQEQHQVRQLRRAAREAAGEAAAAGSAQEESLRRERGELLLRVGELQAALDAAGGKAAHLEEACAAAHEECSILRVRQRELEEGVAAAYANFHSAEQAKQAAVSAANAQAARNSQLTQELGHDWRGLQEQLKASDDELARLRRERLTMARQLAGTSEKLEVLQMEADALGHDKKRLQQLVDQLRAGAGGAEQEDIGAAEPQAIIRELRAALRMVQPQIKELQVEVNQLRAEREVVESQANSAKVYFQGQLRVRLTELQAAEAETGRLQEALDAHLAAAHRLEVCMCARVGVRMRACVRAWVACAQVSRKALESRRCPWVGVVCMNR
jgi:chromosome segregation ATPase